MKKEETKKIATQAHIPIAEIRQGVIILKDGSLRAILMVGTVNFDLKSAPEQEALIYSYQNFLNSLDFPIQILIQSRKIDLSGYLRKLEQILKETNNALLKIQIEHYINFVSHLLKAANIMNKTFYVVIPYHPPFHKKPRTFLEKISSLFGGRTLKMTQQQFEKYKKELMQRVNVVSQQLGSMGLRSVQLTTQEIIELLYNSYNPGTGLREKLISVDELTAPVIKPLREEG